MTVTFPLNGQQVSLDLTTVQNLSVTLLGLLDQAREDRHTCIAAVAMTLGRLTAPGFLDDGQDQRFVEDVMDWTLAYFPEGEV